MTHYFTGKITTTHEGSRLLFACGESTLTKHQTITCSVLFAQITCPTCKKLISGAASRGRAY